MTDVFAGARRRFRRLWNYRKIERVVRGKRGLEIGGPSTVFSPEDPSAYIPAVYAIAGSVDNCNFATDTVWSQGEAGKTFHYLSGTEPGNLFLHDATELASIQDSSYDFLLASHILEHVANPLRAVAEFHRVLKPGGTALVLVPNPAHTFDHRRPVTTMTHLESDLAANTSESDMTHLEEILALHDFEMHNPTGSVDEFRDRCLHNLSNRCMHHHVFGLELLETVFRSGRFRPLYLTSVWSPHLIIFARRA